MSADSDCQLSLRSTIERKRWFRIKTPCFAKAIPVVASSYDPQQSKCLRHAIQYLKCLRHALQRPKCLRQAIYMSRTFPTLRCHQFSKRLSIRHPSPLFSQKNKTSFPNQTSPNPKQQHAFFSHHYPRAPRRCHHDPNICPSYRRSRCRRERFATTPRWLRCSRCTVSSPGVPLRL